MIVAKQAGKYITLQRIRQPFIGAVEWPAGTVLVGEAITDAAKRILYNRLGVNDELHFAGMFRRIDVYKDIVFDDKLFAIRRSPKPNKHSW